jgi:hypothetical protein
VVDFSLAEKKLFLDNLPHFIRMELWDAPSGIAIVSKNIEVVYLEERALVTSIQSMRNTECGVWEMSITLSSEDETNRAEQLFKAGWLETVK